MNVENLARRVAEAEDASSAYGCELIDFKDYKLIKYADCMYGWNVNQVRDINCENDNLPELIGQIEQNMGWPYRQFCIYTDFRTRPQNISYALREAGYRPIPLLTQVFGGEKLKEVDPWEVAKLNDGNIKAWCDLIVSMYAETDRGEVFAKDMIEFGLNKISSSSNAEEFTILLCMKGDVAVGQAEVYTKDKVTSIGNIYVRPKYRKCGIATNLIYQGIDMANSISSEIIYLVTYSFDTPRYAYFNMGFKDLSEGILWARFDDDQFDLTF